MIRLQSRSTYVAGLAVVFALVPGIAMASEYSSAADATDSYAATQSLIANEFDVGEVSEFKSIEQTKLEALSKIAESMKEYTQSKAGSSNAKASKKQSTVDAKSSAAKSKSDLVLKYDRKLIEKVGTQEISGHTICCPSFSCAYGDVVIDGTVHDHDYYTCSCCTWTDWGGGGSSDRCVGTDEELLREAYDQIRSGKPTVIHVAGQSGEHWICLIGYKNVKDPDHLDLSNFVALDPWDGAQIVASDRYTLYGDGCEHISER